jgi:uncharacterized protein YndB with AHSA1/START domain
LEDEAVRVERDFTVQRAPEEVFDYLGDVTNEAKWNHWAMWVRKVSDGPIGRGSVFRGSYQGFGELDQDLSEYEHPHRLTYHSTPKGMRSAEMTFDLSPDGSGTRIRIVGSAEPGGLMKLVEPLMGLRMRPHFAELEKGIRRELG